MVDRQKIHRLGAQTQSLPPDVQQLVSYWLRKCSGRLMPAGCDLSTEELRPWNGHLAVIESLGEGRFVVRRSGFELIRRLGREATGLDVAELAADLERQLHAVLAATTRAAAPVVACSAVPLGHTTAWFCDVALPLARPIGGMGAVLFCSYPTREV